MGNLLKVIASSSILGLGDFIEETVEILIAPIFWGLCDIFFIIIDLFETLYKKFAGIEEFVVGKDTVSQDPVLYLINTDVVQEIFFSIVTLSMILLIIFTIFAIVKNIYAEKPKPLGEILRSMTKALLMYLLVPIATIVCLLVGNVVLRAIDGATKIGGASTTSDMLFMSAAYNANRLRDENDDENVEEFKVMIRDGHLTARAGVDKSSPQYKKYISDLSANGITLSGSSGDIDYSNVNWDGVATAVDEAYLAGVIGGNKWYYGTVRDYYHVLRINFITVWAGGVFLIFAMGKISWGLISRMFKMTVYYAISPALMAMFPIKGDAVLKSWTGEMVKNATMAYCAIGVMNLVFAVLPAFNQVKFFGNNHIFNGLAVLFIDIVAITSAEKLISTVSGWFGTGDALAEGKAAQSGAMKPVKAVGKAATGAFIGGVAAGNMAKGLGAGKGAQFGAFLSGAIGGAGIKNPVSKQIQDSMKSGKEKYKEMSTYDTKKWGFLTGATDKDKMAQFEAREAIDDEDKRIAIKLAMAQQTKEAQLAGIKRSDFAEGEAGDEAYKKAVESVEEHWKKAMDKIKSSASYLSDLFAVEEEDIKTRAKQRDKKQEAMQHVSQYASAMSSDEILKNTLVQEMRSKSHDPNAINSVLNNWDKVKTGNLAGLDGLGGVAGNFVKKWIASNGEEIRSVEQSIKSAEVGLVNYAQAGGSGVLSGLLGDNYKNIFTGSPGEEQINRAGIAAMEDFNGVVREAQESINKLSKAVKASEDALEKQKAEMQGTILANKEMVEKVAKNKKKK